MQAEGRRRPLPSRQQSHQRCGRCVSPTRCAASSPPRGRLTAVFDSSYARLIEPLTNLFAEYQKGRCTRAAADSAHEAGHRHDLAIDQYLDKWFIELGL